MTGALPQCTPGKSYNCGKICLPMGRMCRLQLKERQESAKLVILGRLLKGKQPKALPPAKKKEKEKEKEKEPDS